MEMILNENDMVIGASFSNGTIQDYVDDANTYGLIRIDETVANWFLFNKEDSDENFSDQSIDMNKVNINDYEQYTEDCSYLKSDDEEIIDKEFEGGNFL